MRASGKFLILANVKTIPVSDLDQIVTLAERDLRALAGKRIFITGGTGYIGHWLVESILHANRTLGLGAQLTILSRRAQTPLEAVTFVQGDVRDFAFPKDAFDFVIHAATDVIAQNTPLETYDVTTAGTRRVLEFTRICGAGRILMLSSGAVYGDIPPDVSHVPEDFRGGPRVDRVQSAYGIGKVATEWMGNAYGDAYGFVCTTARVFAQVGPHLALDKHFAAGNFIRDALKGGPFTVNGDGTPTRSYMYGVDLAVWLWAILVRGAHSRAYNVGSDKSLSIYDLVVETARAAGLSAPVITVRDQPKPGALPAPYVPDIMRAGAELGLQITVPLQDALRRTIDWYKD